MLSLNSQGFRWAIGSVVACLVVVVMAERLPRPQGTEAEAVAEVRSVDPDELIQPITAPGNLDARKIELGRRLLHDGRLSSDDQISCASCHDLAQGGTDRKKRSTGIHQAVGIINAPTVFNSGFNFSQFWDGQAPTLEKQIDDPVQSKIEMGSQWTEVVAKLKGSRDYIESFRLVYRDDINADHIKDAIAEFERSLATPNSRFDRYHGTSQTL